MKYDFSLMTSNLDPITSLVFTLQDAIGILTYALILIPTLILFYQYSKTTQDVGKSAIYASWIMLLLTTILYYWGIVGGYESLTGKSFVQVTFLYIVIVCFIIGLVALKFTRSSSVQ